LLQKVGVWPPNYIRHIQWRAETLCQMQTDDEVLYGAQRTYNKDPAQWVDDWVDTIDPRNAASGQLGGPTCWSIGQINGFWLKLNHGATS
jgi:hypothetical protein